MIEQLRWSVLQSLWQMADDDDVVCPLPALRKVRRRRHFTRRDAARARHGQSAGPRLTQCLLPHSRCHTRATRRAALHSRATIRRPASRAVRTSSSTTWPALIASSRRAQVWHQRQESARRARHATQPLAAPTPSPRPHKKKRAGDCEPYYFDWLKCIDKCAMPHIMQKLK